MTRPFGSHATHDRLARVVGPIAAGALLAVALYAPSAGAQGFGGGLNFGPAVAPAGARPPVPRATLGTLDVRVETPGADDHVTVERVSTVWSPTRSCVAPCTVPVSPGLYRVSAERGDTRDSIDVPVVEGTVNVVLRIGPTRPVPARQATATAILAGALCPPGMYWNSSRRLCALSAMSLTSRGLSPDAVGGIVTASVLTAVALVALLVGSLILLGTSDWTAGGSFSSCRVSSSMWCVGP